MLTGAGTRFSAGLDLGEHLPLFAGDPAAVASWFGDYRATNMRLFTYPRPTVAALNGHAFAGGLITAAVCDYRVAVHGGARFGLNEVPIGIPMPAKLENILCLCKRHHAVVHDKGINIATADDGFVFYMPDGITPSTIIPPHSGERLDLHLAIWICFANAKNQAAAASSSTVSTVKNAKTGIRRTVT